MKLRAVQAMLAFHLDEVVPSDILGDGLWGEQPPASTANTVQVHVSWLRVPLPHVVARRPASASLR